jgi:hypothetical protein
LSKGAVLALPIRPVVRLWLIVDDDLLSKYEKRFRPQRLPVVREINPVTDPPASAAPAPGTVQVKAGGMKLTVPWVAVLTLLSAIGGAIGVRSIPTPSTQDSRLDSIQQQLITADMNRARELEERRRESQAQEDRLRALQTQISLLEVQVASLQHRQP